MLAQGFKSANYDLKSPQYLLHVETFSKPVCNEMEKVPRRIVLVFSFKSGHAKIHVIIKKF